MTAPSGRVTPISDVDRCLGYAGRVSEEVLDPPQVFGGYLLLAALGRGAMGDVFLARPLHPNRGVPSPVVVKRLHGELAAKAGFVSRFRHEAAVAVCVDSPHVARVYDVGAVDDTLYIALEYVPGWPLSKVLDAVLKSGRHASVASVVDLVAGGLEGLHALHTAVDGKTGKPLEIVHRDLSPKNLMVGEDGRMRIIDLGLGKSNAQDWKTRTGVVMGSVGYMPPEQARGERVDARADVFAMGVVAFEMLALRNFVKRGSISEMMAASAAPIFVRPGEFRPDVPKQLDLVIDKALRPDRAQRFDSAKAFLDALRAVVPPAYTQGGMASLLEELFGDTRQIREAKLARLLNTPPPDDFETRPTKVFVVRDGIVPLDETKVSTVPAEGPPSARTALTEVSMRGKEPVKVRSASNAAPKRQASLPSTAQVQTFDLRPSKGVSVPMLVLAVLAAAVVGGVVAVFVVLAVLEDRAPAPAPEPVAAPAPTPTPAPPRAPTVTERPPAPARAEAEVEAEPPPRRSPRAAAKRRAPPPAAPATPPPPRPADEGLDAALDRLERRARAARAAAESADGKSAATRVLLDIAVWRRAKDADRKREAIRELEARVGRL